MTAIYAAVKFDKFAGSLAAKKIDLNTDSIKAMLLSAYTPAPATHQYVSDVKAAGAEAAGTGYTAGGATLSGVTWALTSGVWRLKGTIPAWNAAGGSLAAKFALFYDATPGTDATNPVICYWDLANNTTVTATNDNFTLTPDATDGIIKIT